MKKILIVDDSKSIRDLLMDLLEQEGYQAHTANNGSKGLELALATQFDMVITDIHMPEMDGLQFTHKLRTSQSYKYAPILIMSFENSIAMKSEGKRVGATGWLVKPIKTDQLLTAINRLI